MRRAALHRNDRAEKDPNGHLRKDIAEIDRVYIPQLCQHAQQRTAASESAVFPIGVRVSLNIFFMPCPRMYDCGKQRMLQAFFLRYYACQMLGCQPVSGSFCFVKQKAKRRLADTNAFSAYTFFGICAILFAKTDAGQIKEQRT